MHHWQEKRSDLVRFLSGYAGGNIHDSRVIDALLKVPRHLFVLPDMKAHAYENRALPIECAQTISQPYIVALMSQWLAVKPHHRILEIGTGSGYQTAILSLLAGEVYSIEIHPHLHEKAKERLRQLNIDNALLRLGDGYHGWPSQAPFDGIMLTCYVPEIPSPLQNQLKKQGRIVAPIGSPHRQDLILLENLQTGLAALDRLPVRFVPLIRGTNGE